MDRLDGLQLFVRVAECGSFSKAARAAGIGQPAVSKRIAALEARLGAQLLRRTSRGLSLTEAGQGLYESAVRLLGELDAAEARVGRGQASPAGRLRVAMSPAFGRMYVVPRLAEFLARFPGITVELDISERYVDLVEDGIDVAIRIGRLPDSSLIARRIGSMEAATVAAPRYLERFGEPATPAELERHAAVVFVFRGAPRPWEFAGPSGSLTILPKAVLSTNDAEHIRAAVRAGLGIGHAASWLFAGDLAAGTLRRILAAFTPPPYPISAVSPGGRLVPGKTKVFIDFLAGVCAAEPTLRLR